MNAGGRAAPDFESVRVATEHYYWRPHRALSRTFQLDEYVRASVRFEHPVMDLGCGDGTFGSALRQRGVIDTIDVGLDGSADDLRAFGEKPKYGLVQANLCRLPLRSASLGSIVANAVLSSLVTDDEAGVDQALSEVHRVLQDGGLFVFTVAVPRFNENLAFPKVLRRVGGKRLLELYLRRVNRRHSHTQLLEPERWLEKLERARLVVEQCRPFFTRRQARWYSALHLARGFPLLKLLPHGWVQRKVARIEARLFRSVFVKEQARSQEEKGLEAGFLLWAVRKAPGGAIRGTR